ncbi:MAG: DUF4097 domain-containing protein [Candidatus Aminicenantes bacterium]|nr:DUF4097 domain-containing protein [Candidatus Aminicenantes bacterium]
MSKRTNGRIARIAVLALLAAATCGWAPAQAKEEPPDRAVVPLSKPGQPAKIEVSVMRGSITVKAYEGKDIIVEARTREKALSNYMALAYATGVPYAVVAPPAPPAVPPPATRPAPAAKPDTRSEEVLKRAQEIQKDSEARLMAKLTDQEALAKKVTGYAKAIDLYGEHFQDDKERREEKEKKIAGMKQLTGSSSGLEIEEEANVVQIRTESFKAATDLVIQVPVATSLEIRSSMDGAILVEGVSGEIDINNINGPVTLRNVSGNTLVHTVNGDIEAVLARVAADKPLSFSSMTGDIDVTLPPDTKASVKMKTDQGEIYTDFDVDMSRQPTRTEAGKTEEGRYRITFDKSLVGIINGGGREISFNTFIGDIFIRKRK